MNTVVFYINGTGVKAGSPISSVPSLMNTLYTLTLTPESEEQAQKIGQLAWCLDGNCSQGNESPLEIGAAKDLQSESKDEMFITKGSMYVPFYSLEPWRPCSFYL